jgi:hypothetical protein
MRKKIPLASAGGQGFMVDNQETEPAKLRRSFGHEEA